MEKLLGKTGKMNTNIEFVKLFKNKTIFMTGHTGFIGSWLSFWLTSMGSKVVGYSLEPPTNPSLFDTLGLKDSLTHIIGDVNDKTKLYESIVTSNPDFVFHLAAQPLVTQSYEKPIETFQTNIMGTANLLDSMKQMSNISVCIVFTSDKCYENRETNHAYTENDPVGGHDPYSASKGSAELIVQSYRNSFFKSSNDEQSTSIATIRSGNVIGGGDWAENRIVSDCIKSLINDKPIPLRNPQSIRPWQHVLEPISGIFCLAKKMWEDRISYSEPWNFGPDITNTMNVKELVEQIINEWGMGSWEDISHNDAPHEAKSLMLDSSKAKKSLDWNPVYSTKEAIEQTTRWYKEYYEKNVDMKDFTLSQIVHYVKKAEQLNIIWAKNT